MRDSDTDECENDVTKWKKNRDGMKVEEEGRAREIKIPMGDLHAKE